MVLASAFRLHALIAGCFLGGSGRQTVPSVAAITVEPGHIAQVGSPSRRVTENRFNEACSQVNPISV